MHRVAPRICLLAIPGRTYSPAVHRFVISSVAAMALVLGTGGAARAQDNTLSGALIGGAAGAGLGYAFGKGKGAAIGGVSGLALGALAGAASQRRDERVYAPPPPVYYAPGPVYYAAPPPAYYAPPPSAYPPPPPPPPVPAPAAAATEGYSTAATCREYSGTIVVDGQEQRSYGTACLQPDGTWRIVR